MRVLLLAVGRLGRTPETALATDWLQRAGATGRSLGLGPFGLVEIEAKRPGKTAEAEMILSKVDPDDRLVACDERGRSEPSRAFAARLAAWRDGGARRTVCVIGGADGLDEAVRARADALIGFGAQTWPHALARAMLAEQLYRATTILSGSPYHRD